MSNKITTITGDNWQEFLESGTAFLLVGKTGCEACSRWTEELNEFLEKDTEFSEVKFGKVDLKTKGLIQFKKANADWLAELEVLPFNLIYKEGEKVKDFAGSGIERLQNRLRRVVA